MSWSVVTIQSRPGDLCESCHAALVTRELTDQIEPRHPYRLCAICLDRLETYSLRPLEYFNVAALHSPFQYHLHDDFYDEDGNSVAPLHLAAQAEMNALPAPTLDDVKSNLERLLDYAFTRWRLRDDVIVSLCQHSPADVLGAINGRVALVENEAIHSRSVEICAAAVGPVGADWLREQWNGEHSDRMLWALSQASAACLPLDEGLDRVIGALDRKRDSRFHNHAGALAYFRSPRVLNWIETELNEPHAAITESWGRLAAVSQLTWDHVERWLSGGRPLSLVALDGLISCFHYNTLLLREFHPKLSQPPEGTTAFAALDQCAERDPVPRVTRSVSTIKKHWNDIVAH